MSIFIIMYWAAIVMQILIRALYIKNQRTGVKSDNRSGVQEKVLLGLLTLGGFVIPLIYSVTSWLNFADYKLPPWSGWIGVAILIASLFVFWRAHADLGPNWSPTLEIRADQTLITFRSPLEARSFQGGEESGFVALGFSRILIFEI